MWRILTRYLLTASWLGALLPVPAGVAQPQPPAPERAPRQIVNEDLLELQAGLAAEDPAAAEPPDGIASAAGKLVYQSFRDGNWEIYFSTDEGAGAVRLTSDPAADIEPRLSPDGTQVVFTSKRTGNYELYVTNVNGTGLRQLTTHPGVDGSPAWSPDGKRIAFSSDRDGNPEIYAMNADGSGLMRLTQAPGYDDEPAWSPDGRRIAFTSRRTGDEHSYYIWMMNVDGSNVVQMSTHWYSANPTWSADGQLLFFDVANDRGWSRLMYVPAAGGPSTPMALMGPPGSYYHAWMSAVGFRGTLYFTVALYGVNGNKLVLQDLRTYRGTNTPGGLSYQGPLLGSLDVFADWRNSDWAPPLARVVSAGPVAYGSIGGPRFTVMAVDDGTAGVASVEAQYRTPADSNWLSATCWSSGPPGTFECGLPMGPGWYGIDVRVRARAIDAMDNVQLWPEDDGVLIRAYSHVRQGLVTDLRGYPVSGASVFSPSSIVGQPTTDAAGRFTLYMGAPDPAPSGYQITATAPGMGVSPVWGNLRDGHPTAREPILQLAPRDDVIVNGGFDGGLEGWQTRYPSAVSVQATVGNGISDAWAQLIPSAATRNLLLEAPEGGSLMGAYSPSGVALLRTVNGSTQSLIFCPTDSACTTTSLGERTVEGMTFTTDGALWLMVGPVGTEPRQLLQRSAVGSWASPVTISLPGGSLSELFAGPDGQLHWIRYDPGGAVYHAIRSVNGTWTDASFAGGFLYGAKAAIGANGQIAIVGCTGLETRAYLWSPIQGWSNGETVRPGECRWGPRHTSLDSQGNVYAHFTAVDTTSEVFAARDQTGIWTLAPEPTTTKNYAFPGSPSPRRLIVGVSRQTRQLVVFGASTDMNLMAYRLLPNGTWSAPEQIGYLFFSDLVNTHVIDWDEASQRILFAAYRQGTPSITYNLIADDWHYGPLSSSGPALTQFVRIPNASENPTVALELSGLLQGSEARVLLTDQTGTVHLLHRVGPTQLNGQRIWLDLSPWRGQAVSITIQAIRFQYTTGDALGIDDVQLGSWHTPIITGMNPAELPLNGGVLTVSGQNLSSQGRAWIGPVLVEEITQVDGNSISIHVPPGIPPGIWPVVVASTQGAQATTGIPVRVGQLLYMPLLANWSRK